MNKPKYLLPFIYVYRIVVFFPKLIIRFFNYASVGFFFTLFYILDIIISSIISFFKMIYLILKYAILGFITFCRFFYIGINFVATKTILKFIKNIYLGFTITSIKIYRFIKYAILGIALPFALIYKLYVKLQILNQKMIAKQQLEQEKRNLAKERNRKILEENRKRLAEIRAKEKNNKQKEQKKDIYINENVTIEKKKIADYLNDFLNSIASIPSKIKKYFANLSFVKHAQNKKDINREALLLDFEGEDAVKSEKKVMYKYVAKDPNGKIIKGYFPAYSKVEVHSFLLSEGNEVYSIETNKWIQRLYGNMGTNNRVKIKTKDLIFFTTQLSTYIKAGIPLVEALKILTRQFKNKNYSRIFRAMIYDLTMGDSFSTAMDKQGEAFPRLLINMVKASEMTGELPEVLDDMANYFTEADRTKKQMITAMTYPTIIFVFAMAAIVFIMVWVVPQFVGIYADIDGATLPGITVFVMDLSAFLQKNYLYLIIIIAIIIGVIYYLYKYVKSIKTFIQWILMHLPVIGNVIIYNEVTMFTKTFASLLSHNVFITDSMEILNKITNNEIYKMLILDTITNLAKGEKISLAFKDHWAFPIPAYEMITTGERTGQLAEMMSKVSSYYQELHKNSVTRIKTFVEPVLILFLAVVVGGIVLAIVVPMFGIYSSIQME